MLTFAFEGRANIAPRGRNFSLLSATSLRETGSLQYNAGVEKTKGPRKLIMILRFDYI